MVVQRADADAGAVGDLLERHVDAALVEQLGRGRHQMLAVPQRICPQCRHQPILAKLRSCSTSGTKLSMASTSTQVIVVVGVGPGLGLSVAHRFGKEGFAVALVSRSADRHAAYLRALDAAGVDATAFTADAADPAQLRGAVNAARKHFGRIDVGYYGPAASADIILGDITTLDAAGALAALRGVVPAVDFASLLLPELTARGSGGLIFPGRLSSVVPMPPLGGMA